MIQGRTLCHEDTLPLLPCRALLSPHLGVTVESKESTSAISTVRLSHIQSTQPPPSLAVRIPHLLRLQPRPRMPRTRSTQQAQAVCLALVLRLPVWFRAFAVARCLCAARQTSGVILRSGVSVPVSEPASPAPTVATATVEPATQHAGASTWTSSYPFKLHPKIVGLGSGVTGL